MKFLEIIELEFYSWDITNWPPYFISPLLYFHFEGQHFKTELFFLKSVFQCPFEKSHNLVTLVSHSHVVVMIDQSWITVVPLGRTWDLRALPWFSSLTFILDHLTHYVTCLGFQLICLYPFVQTINIKWK